MGRRALAGVAAALLLAACGGDGGDGADAADSHAHDHDHSHMEEPASFSFGSPGKASAATRTVEVATTDPYRFEPAALQVESGETVTFVVTNEGEEDHEFVLGDVAYQEEHGEAMASGAMHHEGNAVTVAPGDTEELTWTFPSVGDVLYACHVGGHYDSGMVGVITISA
ncbi:MAG: plastocyanin/azurin family copper-binding protein [Actinomycetota bacterium]|nr:plastocyanin/azurin family copper-binding protein [Actinomycetota bacterium]